MGTELDADMEALFGSRASVLVQAQKIIDMGMSGSTKSMVVTVGGDKVEGLPEPPRIEVGDLVVFRPPLPRCQYQGGTFLGARDDVSGVTCRIRLPSGLEIAVKASSLKKAGWLESLALQAK